MITMHGAIYLAHRTEGVIQQRASRGAVGAALLMVLAFAGAGLWLRYGGIDGYAHHARRSTPTACPTRWPRPWCAAPAPGWPTTAPSRCCGCCRCWASAARCWPPVLLVARRTLGRVRAPRRSPSSGVIGTAGVSMFPFVMPSSTMPDASLTVWDSVSSHLTLGLMFWATLIFMPLIVFYTSWAYRVMRGKVTLAQISANEHNAY